MITRSMGDWWWTGSYQGDYFYGVLMAGPDDNSVVVATCVDDEIRVGIADGALIEAAPDMLTGCELALSILVSLSAFEMDTETEAEVMEVREYLETAIAKARGEHAESERRKR